jgi:hypothetical protein
MANKKRKSLEEMLVEFITKDFSRLEEKVDANTKLTQATKEQAEKTNGRVNINEGRLDKIEGKIFGKNGVKESNPEKLPPVWRDKRILNIVMIVALAFLILVAAATKFDLSKVLHLI